MRRELFALWIVWAASWPQAAFAADSSWKDSHWAFPVFAAGALLVTAVAWGFAKLFRSVGRLLWWGIVTAVGFHAVFAQTGAFQELWQAGAFLVGAALFLIAAGRALNRLSFDTEAQALPESATLAGAMLSTDAMPAPGGAEEALPAEPAAATHPSGSETP